MKKRLVRLLAGILISGNCALSAFERTYASTGVFMHCEKYDDIYDSRGNLKNPHWYMPVEEVILTSKRVQKALTKRTMSTLVGRSAAEKIDYYVQYGVPTIQFSHQFITDHSFGAKARVCRVYYMMLPYKEFEKGRKSSDFDY
ncbi:hypothetical protein KC460_04545 [Candidatus Dependentiae bacterium]|nr:hypothetical protein [Candidatus Dependentiae bacterium]